jgi:DNA-binding transcriptional LysR family regulator
MVAAMDLRHLRNFIGVAEEQNVTRAAARLHLTQPALSRQIRALEDELGLALFAHGARSVRLTEAGRVFLTEARGILLRAEEAIRAAKAVASGERGELQVGYAPSLTVELLPHTLRCFQEANPGVRVQLHDLSTQEMLRGLRENKLHAALLIQLSAKVMADLAFEKLHHYAVCVALSPAHPLARARKIGLPQLARERLIAFTLADYPEYHAWLADLFASQDQPPPIAEEHDSATSLIASIEAGRGIALVQEAFTCFAGPRVKIRPLVPAPPPLVIGLAFRQDARSRVLNQFLAAAKKASGHSRFR